MRKNVGTILGMTLFLGAFAACDNNPLKDDRDKGAYMYTNPSFAQVTIGGTVKVRANVMNKYTAPTGDAVTGTPCDAKLTVVADTSRTEFEQPERFVVTGVGLGKSCLIVSGGGVTDTVDFVVGPAAIDVTGDSTIIVDQRKPLAVAFLGTAGTAQSGLSISDVSFVSRNTAVLRIDTLTNEMVGVTPGTTFVVGSTKAGRGQVRSDSIQVRVAAGPFGGTAPTTIAGGSLVTLTAGPIPFDANTRITVNGDSVFVVSNTPTTYSFVAPAGTTGSGGVVITGLGTSDVIQVINATLTNEAGEPDSRTAARPLTVGTTVYGSVNAADLDDWFTFTIAAPQTLLVTLNWVGGGTSGTNDVDAAIFLGTAGAQVAATTAAGCESSARPENCTFNLAAGTYTVNVHSFARVAGTSQPYSLFIRP